MPVPTRLPLLSGADLSSRRLRELEPHPRPTNGIPAAPGFVPGQTTAYYPLLMTPSDLFCFETPQLG
jgi:hypothetical protein